MTEFLHGGALWWLAAALPAILALYFLRLRRTRLTVSSTLLWSWAVEDMRANAPFQRLRASALLVLQLLVMTLCVAALAQPFLPSFRATGTRAAIIIDCSASMAVRDAEGGDTRLLRAKRIAHAIIDGMESGTGASGGLCVITASSQARLACGITTDARLLRAAVESVAVRETETRMDEALRLAVAVMGQAPSVPAEASPGDTGTTARAPSARVSRVTAHILSDGAFADMPADVADMLAAESRFIAIGKADTPNAGITAAEFRTEADTEARTLFLRIENHGPERSDSVTLTLDGTLHDRKPVALPAASADGPGGATVTFLLRSGVRGLLTATLDLPDGLAEDNVFHGVLAPTEDMRILLVSQGNPFIESFLAVTPGVRAERWTPERWQAERFPDGQRAHFRRADGEDIPYDLVIFDRWTPAPFPAFGSYLVMGAVPALEGLSVDTAPGRGVVLWPGVLDWRRQHPLMRHITAFDSLHVLRTPALRLGGGWVPVVEAQGVAEADRDRADTGLVTVPLIAAEAGMARRVALVAFDLYDTPLPGWPAQISFTLFMGNAVEWLARPGGADRAAARTGEPLTVAFTRPVRAITLERPGGALRLEPTPENTVLYADVDRAGFYTFTADTGESRVFACNLLSDRETDIAARARVRFGDTVVEGATRHERGRVDFWPWLVGAGILLLLLEWHVYNRRILG